MKRIWIVLFVFMCLALAACGAGGGNVSTSINVTMTDFQFTPNEFTIPAGKEITINATNNGAVIHNFVIMKLGQTAGDKFDAADQPNVYWELEIQPGGSASATFTAPTESGDYQVVCKTAGHLEAGMIAKLTVVTGE
jgi:uncharacterized cupredoxin-like copper-binding protein